MTTETTEQLHERTEGRRLTKLVTIRIPEDDLDLAREQAARKGMPYQTYIKSLLHEALRQHEVR